MPWRALLTMSGVMSTPITRPVGPTFWTCDEDVETAAAAQVQDHLAGLERGDGRRVPAGKAHIGSLRQRGQLRFAVPHALGHLLGGSRSAARVELHRRSLRVLAILP